MPTGIKTNDAMREANMVDESLGKSIATDPPLVLIVSVVSMGPPAGVTLAGLKLQLAPVGNPEQAKFTG